MRLTLAQRRHLAEMIGDGGVVLFWRPYGSGQTASARTLYRKGLLAYAQGGYGTTYELTEEGEGLARALAAARVRDGDDA